MTLEVGDDIDVDEFLNKLVNMGYRRESVVSHIGEFSLRGGIIDIYPLSVNQLELNCLTLKSTRFETLM